MAHGFEATEIAWNAPVGSSAERLTLLALAKWASAEMTCYPSIPAIAEVTCLNKKTVRDSLKKLSDAGIVCIERKPGHNSIYKIVSTPTESGTTKNGTTKNGSTPKFGNTPVPKTEGVPLPKTVPEHIREQISNREVVASADAPASDVQEVTHVQDHAHVQETASRCAGNSTSDVQEVAHRKDQLKEQEEITTHEGTPRTEDTPNFEGTTNSMDTGTPRTEDTGTPKTRDLKKEEKKEKSMYAPSVEVAPTPASSKPSKKEPQGTRFTLENLPDNWRAECRRIQPKADPAKVFEEFRDHWISQPGAKGRKSDWTATWRNWCRRINARDLERVGYEPGRSQFMVKPEPVNPFKVTPQNCPPRQKTEEELEAERSFDLFERVLNGEV